MAGWTQKTPTQTSGLTAPTPTQQLWGSVDSGSMTPISSTTQRQPYTQASTIGGTGSTAWQGGSSATPQTHPAFANFDDPSLRPPLQAPGNNMLNPGYTEQGVEAVQNRLLQDPYADQMQDQYQQTQTPSAGEDYLNENLGSLAGPGQGEQYWQQQQGAFNGPGQGSEFTRGATAAFSPEGQAGAFNNQAQGQYDDFANYQGAGNAQGQYGENAAFGPNASQAFYDQAAGDYDSRGTFSDPNRAAGQYEQTQGAFGDMPIAQFDPFYDRARQLGVQSYNQDAAGRGVYGSSESLSGVGNVITDIEAQRANRSFDAEMQRAQEQRMRQQLLGEQARAGDLSALGAFDANLAGTKTYGDLASQAASNTTAQQTMLGNQADAADDNAQAAQDSNIRGVDVLGGIANNADARATDRYRETTGAMNAADRNDVDRLRAGADIADMADDNARGDYDSSNAAAVSSASTRDQRIDTGIQAADVGSDNDLARLDEFGDQTGQAEDDRQNRAQSQINEVASMSRDMANLIGKSLESLMGKDQEAFDDAWQASILPALQAAGLSEQEQQRTYEAMMTGAKIGINAISD
jgi:hypothetical protein